MEKMSVSRREFLRRSVTIGVGVAALPLIVSCAMPAPATETEPMPEDGGATEFDWKRYAGEEIEVTFTLGNLVDVLLEYQDEFEELTGITVGAEQIPEQQARQKQVMEFNSGATSFDVCHYSYHVHKRLYAKNHWTLDLREYINDPIMTPEEFDWADFSEGAVKYATDTEGRICSIPIKIDFWILFWNKEIFEAGGVDYPETFEDMLAAAKALHDPDNNMFGYLARGLKNANVPVWTHLMQGWDMDPISPDGTFNTTSPEAVEAATFYQSLLKDVSAAGASGFNWNECQSAFALGQGAMWQDGIGFATPLEDVKESKVAGKVGFGVFPKGPKAQHSAMFGDGIGVSAYTDKKGPAYYYCLWATNKINSLRVLQAGAAVPPRTSALTDPNRAEGSTMPPEYFDCLEGSGANLRAGLPEIMPVTEFRDVFGIALTNMIGGADPATELAKATEDFMPIYEKSEQG